MTGEEDPSTGNSPSKGHSMREPASRKPLSRNYPSGDHWLRRGNSEERSLRATSKETEPAQAQDSLRRSVCLGLWSSLQANKGGLARQAEG